MKNLFEQLTPVFSTLETLLDHTQLRDFECRLKIEVDNSTKSDYS